MAKVLLTGRDLIRMGMKPGPHFNEILNMLKEARLAGKLSSLEDEKKWLRKSKKWKAFLGEGK